MQSVHGTARLSDDGKVLTVTTNVKKGKRFVEKTEEYAVADAKPDPSVAFPVFSLTKKDGTVYHVGVNEYGPFCDCPNAIIREKYGAVDYCKHVRILQRASLLPKDHHANRNQEETQGIPELEGDQGTP
jgi:predicted nucleic acid-binding Zn finger protein